MSESAETNAAPDVTEKKAAAKKSATSKKVAAKKPAAKKKTGATAQKDTVKKETVKKETAKTATKKPSVNKRMASKSAVGGGTTATVDVDIIDMTDTESMVENGPIIIEEPLSPMVVNDGSAHEEERHGGFLNMLYRHPSSRMAAGVCGGIADYIGWDPVLVRALWVVATVMTGGGGILAYMALALLLPVGTKRNGFVRPGKIEMTEQNLGRASYGLIALGVVWLLSNMGILSFIFDGASAILSLVFWPALFITVGLLLLNRNGDRNYRDSLNSSWNTVRERANSARNSERMPQFNNFQSSNIQESIMNFRQGMPIKRSRSNRVVAGVCGGIGQAVGIDANLVRLGFAVMSIGTAGTPLIAYAMLAVLLPSTGERKRSTVSQEDIVIEEEKPIDDDITIL